MRPVLGSYAHTYALLALIVEDENCTGGRHMLHLLLGLSGGTAYWLAGSLPDFLGLEVAREVLTGKTRGWGSFFHFYLGRKRRVDRGPSHRMFSGAGGRRRAFLGDVIMVFWMLASSLFSLR